MVEADGHRTPGQLIETLLAERGWSQRVLAIVLGIGETIVNKLVSDRRPVDAELALQLAEVFGVPAERFLELQKEYELAQARIVSRPDAGRTMRAHLFGGLPVAEMIRRGWLRDVDSVRDVRAAQVALTRFFGVNDVNEIEILPHAAKKTTVFGDATPTQLAWLYRVKEVASEMLVSRYSVGSVRDVVGKLSDLRHAPEEARKVPRILSECGVRYVIVESLPSAKIDGVCLWLNDTSPVIGMSLRYDRIDNFWFVLRHELEHVLRLHGRTAVMLDAELEGSRAGTGADVAEEERMANDAAANFCIPQAALVGFIARKEPFFAERDIIGFARAQGVHPGIVAGQLQHKTGRHDRFRAHQVKIRTFVAPSATVDGWGDVAPTD